MPLSAQPHPLALRHGIGAIFFSVRAQCAISFLPISVDPVKVSLRTVGFDVISPPIAAADPVITLNTPFGIPALSLSSASANAEYGVWVAGLQTSVHPAASAGPALRVIIAAGKFQGVMAATTPTGCRSTGIRLSAACPGVTSPDMGL